MNFTSSYEFDEVNCLKRLRHSNSFGNLEDFQYNYNLNDEISAITSLNAATTLPPAKVATAANAANRISQVEAASYGFDNHGQTTSKMDATGTTNYSWDARGRLTKAALPNGQEVSYGFDALGRRASRSYQGNTTSFVYDGQDVVADKAGTNVVTDYLNGAGIDDKLRQTSGLGNLYFTQDHLGSTNALTSASGGVVEQLQYEAFGSHNASSLTRYTYTGREDDAATGMMYYRARWFDTQQGRFVTEDPIGMEGGLNLYAYVKNNPVSDIDPLGLFSYDDFLHGLAQGAAGFGDTLSGGLTRKFRQWQGTDGVIDYCSDLYKAGEYGAYAHMVLSGGAGLARGLASRGAAGAAAQSGWRSLPGGVRIKQVGNYFVKEVNPDASAIAQWWGRGGLKAQADALSKLGDMAPNFIFRNGKLITRDAGAYTPGNFGNTWWEGSKRLGTIMNDIRPRNIGANGVIFDPALHPVAKGIYWVAAGGVVGTAGYGIYSIFGGQ